MKTRAQIPDLCSKLGVPCYNCHLMARVLRRKCELLVQGNTLPKGIVTEWEDKPQCVLVTSASMHRHMQADNRQYTHINLSLWTTSAHTLMLWWTIATSTKRTTENLASTTVTGIQVVITVTLCRMTGVQVTITVTLCRMTVAQVTIPVTLCRMTSAQVVITVTLFRVWLFFNESLKLKNYKSKIAWSLRSHFLPLDPCVFNHLLPLLHKTPTSKHSFRAR